MRSDAQLSTEAAQVVEILFARGLVKVLFATETFAMVRSIFIHRARVDYHRRASTCLQSALCFRASENTMGRPSGKSFRESTLRWLGEQVDAALT